MSDPKINVIHVVPGGAEGWGGMGRFVKYLQLAQSDLPSNIQTTILDSYGQSGFRAMPIHFAGSLTKLARLLRRGEIDILHLHMATRGSVMRKMALSMLARAYHVPVVLHLHAAAFDEYVAELSPVFRNALVKWLKSCDRVVVIGHYWQDYMINHVGCRPDTTELVFNGVPAPNCAPPQRGQDGPVQFLTLGELGPRKGTPELLEALASPRLANLNWRAVIAGNGDVEAYRKRAKELGLEDKVSMPGWVDCARAWELLAESDVFVLPSRQEGLPLAILEAMAMKLPVVSTSVGSIPEAVIANSSGLIVPPGQVDDLADALADLVTDPARRHAMGENGAARFAAHFNIKVGAEKLNRLYARMLAKHADLGKVSNARPESAQEAKHEIIVDLPDFIDAPEKLAPGAAIPAGQIRHSAPRGLNGHPW